MKLFENINHLCSYKDAFDFNEKTEKLFFQSMKENFNAEIVPGSVKPSN